MTDSRRKGKDGELELAKLIRDQFGVDARRGQQFAGGPDSPDLVTDFDALHIECKRLKRCGVYKYMDQSRDDSAALQIPTVWLRADGEEWLTIIPTVLLEEFCRHFIKVIDDAKVV